MANSQPILVIDDDPHWRQIVADILTDAGYTTAVFAAAPSALPACQAAVLDVSLSPADPHNRGGFALAEKIFPSPVILLSGAPEDEVADFARAHPSVAGILDKSAFHREDLLALLGSAAEQSFPPPGGAARILIVEDDPGWRDAYADVLGGPGYELQFAVSYGEARGLLQRQKFRAAVVDLHLVSSADPEENRDGFALLRVAAARNLPTIVVSALGAPDDIDRAYDEFGVFAFVEKEAFDRKAFRQTVAEAIQSSEAQPEAPGAAPASSADGALAELTEREREVLALLAKGQTNRQIAETLIITPNTVKKHVDHILQKLGVSTRSAAAAIAARAGLGK
ncbi:MAG: response regulator [Anaerolineales bacterium]|nr:response regulator [Anaerolineales bacterium]